jgi:hypothetical protein
VKLKSNTRNSLIGTKTHLSHLLYWHGRQNKKGKREASAAYNSQHKPTEFDPGEYPLSGHKRYRSEKCGRQNSKAVERKSPRLGSYNTSWIGAFALVSALLLASCTRSVDYTRKYGILYNSERQKRGLPTIPPTWEIQNIGNYFDCVNPQQREGSPERVAKRINVDQKGSISSETDTFASGKIFYDGPDHLRLFQTVTMEYNYQAEKTGNPWAIYADLGPTQRMQKITLPEADRLLGSWGLRRQ